MKNWIKDFFANSNEVNEHTVVGVVFMIATVVAGFVPGIQLAVFYGFMGATLSAFGLKIAATKSALTC